MRSASRNSVHAAQDIDGQIASRGRLRSGCEHRLHMLIQQTQSLATVPDDGAVDVDDPGQWPGPDTDGSGGIRPPMIAGAATPTVGR